jgi:hypothetical protein
VTVTFQGTTLPADGNTTATFVAPGVAPPANPDTSRYWVSSGPKVADGVAQHTLTVRLENSAGQPIIGAAGLIETNRPGVGLFAETDEPGVYEAPWTSTVAASLTVDVTYDAARVAGDSSGNTRALFVPGPVALDHSSITVKPASLGAGRTATATIAAADEFDNPIGGAQVHLWAKPQTNPAFNYTGATRANGTEEAVFTSQTPGIYEVCAEIEGEALPDCAQVVFGPAPVADPANSRLSVKPVRIGTGQRSVASVDVVDQYGEALQGVQVDFATDHGTLLAGGASASSDASGVAKVTLTGGEAGVFEVSAGIGGVGVKNTATLTVTEQVPVATLTGTTGRRVPDGDAFHEAVVQALDHLGNPYYGADVVFDLSGDGRLADGFSLTATADVLGRALLRVVSDEPGTALVAASVNGEWITDESGERLQVALLFAEGT